MSPAVARALRSAAAVKVRPVVLPRPEPVHPGVARRSQPGEVFNARPVAVLRPVPDDPTSVHEECLRSFPPPARRLAR